MTPGRGRKEGSQPYSTTESGCISRYRRKGDTVKGRHLLKSIEDHTREGKEKGSKCCRGKLGIQWIGTYWKEVDERGGKPLSLKKKPNTNDVGGKGRPLCVDRKREDYGG